MRESDLFKAYGMEHDAPIPQTRNCATPKCVRSVLFLGDTLFCELCRHKMEQRLKKAPDG